MSLTVDLPDEVSVRLRVEADRRGITVKELIVEFADRLPAGNTSTQPRLAFVVAGASTEGITTPPHGAAPGRWLRDFAVVRPVHVRAFTLLP